VAIEVEAPFAVAKERERDALFEGRFRESAGYLRTDGDVRNLFGTRRGTDCIVAAGGPTLDDQLPFIVRRRTELVLVVVNRSLIPVLRAGILPDLCVVADPKDETAAHFEGVDLSPLSGVPLVYLPCIPARILELWPGPRYASYLDQPRYARLASEMPRGTLFCLGTVTHMAVDLAVKIGARRVLLAGADFGYVRARSHASGAADPTDLARPDPLRTWVLNGHGQRVATDLRMATYRRDLEAYIAAHPTTEFVNTGRDGAVIEGAPFREQR
jgi:hypothetical protein